MPKCEKDCNTPKVLEIHNHECPVLFHRVIVPAAMGDDETNPPRNGQYRNVLLVYEANGHVYLFSSDGIPTFISDGKTGGVEDYEELLNKPLINGHELIGDSSLEDIGVTDAIDDALEDYTPTSDLAAVALSGDYNDLSNTPTIPVVNDATLTITRNNTSAGTFTANSATNTTIDISVPTKTSDILNDSGFITNAVNNLVNYYTRSETDAAISVETANRSSADQSLQEQIDAISSSSDVVDVVGTYAELQAYDTSKLHDNDIIKVLTDETHDDAISYYRWDDTNEVFTYIGSQGPFYTKSETDATFVPQTRTVNNKALSTDITLTAADVHALPDSTVIPTVNDAVLTIKKEGTSIGTFTANSSTPTAINIVETDPTVPSWAKQPTKPTYSYSEITNTPTIPSKTSDLTNDGSDGTSTYVEANQLATVATSGSYNDLLNKPTIPAAQVNSDWNANSGVAQILNKPTLATVATTGSYNDLTDTPTIDFELVEMSYGESNAWAKFINAYRGHKIVYCRASSQSDPGTGTQGRKAFMAYVNNAENPTEVEFQYVRSVSTKTSSQPVDQVFVYKLTNANGGTWSVQTRDMGPKLAQGTNTTVSYSNGTYTISATQPTVNDATLTIKKNGSSVGTFTANSSTNTDVDITVPTKTSDLTNDSGFIDKNVSDLTNYYDETTVNSMFNALTIPTKTSDLTNDSGFITNTDYASASTGGVVKVGSGLSIDANGVLSSNGLTSVDWSDVTNKPTNVSYWTNDAGYITSAAVPTKTSDLTNDSGFITSASVPTKTSDLTNDSGFITSSVNNLANYYKKSETYTQGEVNSLINAIAIPTKTSDLTNDGSDGTAAYLETDETAYKTASIPYGECDSTSTATAFTATVPGITELRDGVCMLLKNGVVTSASGFTININGLGAKPAYNNMAAATRETTAFNINYTIMFVYDSSRVAGGCWVYYRGYYSDANSIGYQLRTNSTSLTTTDRTRYYRLLFTSADNTHWVPANTQYDNSATSNKTINQRKINPFGRIVYLGNSTSYVAGAAVSATAVWDQYAFNLGYSFSKGSALTMTYPKPVYVKCAPQSDGSAIIDSTTPYVQDLPSTDDGKIYIYLGIAYSATNVEMVINHPIYYYKDGAIREWTNATAGIASVAWGDITGTLSSQTDLNTALGAKANSADLATVATSGSYNDLSNKPTIPTVNNATLTIQKNSTNVATFTANASSNVTANISVPTATSDLTNDSGFITSITKITNAEIDAIMGVS